MNIFRIFWGMISKGGIVIFLLIGLFSMGCSGLHLHQPQDLDNAKKAQTHFRNAALSETVKEERKRLAQVLEQELELVRKHTFARRDARLLFMIGEGETKDPWKFLQEDIKKRITELGLSMDEFQKTVTALSQQSDRLDALLVRTNRWEARRKDNPQLPLLSCTLKSGVPGEPDESMKDDDRENYNSYREACKEYLKVAKPKLGNEELITKIKAAQKEVKNQIKVHKDAYDIAKKNYLDALKKRDESEITKRAEAFRNTFERFGELSNEIMNSEALKVAKKALGETNLGLEEIIKDLTSEATIAKLEVERGQILDVLSAIVDAPSSIPSDAEVPDSAVEVVSVLTTVGKALERNRNYPPVSELQIRAEQLRLNMVAALRSKAFFDKALALIEETQEARVQELLYLARVEQLRRQVVGYKDPENKDSEIKGCLQEELKDKKSLVFETEAGVSERCREKVFKLLAAYSNAWTFGRVPQEQSDYRLIALHHEAALDSSEIAFARWENLLGVPIDQLVALHNTGIRPETVSNIVNALGMGAIAVGVFANDD